MKTRNERTGWRDLGLSARHREWGWDCPAIDIDFLEYDRGKAVALIEYKHEKARQQKPSHPSFRALVDLADRASLPCFAVRYAVDFSWFVVVPLNGIAKDELSERVKMTEDQYVHFLYRLRGRIFPEHVKDNLRNLRQMTLAETSA